MVKEYVWRKENHTTYTYLVIKTLAETVCHELIEKQQMEKIGFRLIDVHYYPGIAGLQPDVIDM